MIVALDFDGTYAASPVAFGLCVSALQGAGFTVITVTSRRKTLANEQEMRQAGVVWPIVFAYDKPKKLAAIEAGYQVDIWIDDNPQGIGDGTESVRTQSVFEIELRHALDVLREAPASYMELDCLYERLATVIESEDSHD